MANEENIRRLSYVTGVPKALIHQNLSDELKASFVKRAGSRMVFNPKQDSVFPLVFGVAATLLAAVSQGDMMGKVTGAVGAVLLAVTLMRTYKSYVFKKDFEAALEKGAQQRFVNSLRAIADKKSQEEHPLLQP